MSRARQGRRRRKQLRLRRRRHHVREKKRGIMGGELTSGIDGVMGAIVGGLASLTSTWVGERSRHRRDLLQREITKREAAYSDFIERASKVYAASVKHRIDDDE